MAAFIGRRLVAALPVLAVVVVVTFTLVHFMPGDPAHVLLGDDATADQIAAMRRRLGGDQPLHLQFIGWLTSVLRGDLGESLFSPQSVGESIRRRAEPTLLLALAASAIGLSSGVVFGVAAALNRGKWVDRVIMSTSTLGIAVPGFFLGFLLIIVFAVETKLLPVAGYSSLSGGLANTLRSLALPALTLGVMQAALVSRLMRTSVIESLQADYVRTARVLGLSTRAIIVSHVMPNALAPTLSAAGVMFGTLLSGAIVVEIVFAIPGIGRLTVDAVLNRDIPMLQGISLVVGVLYIVVNILTDVLQAAINPRLKL